MARDAAIVPDDGLPSGTGSCFSDPVHIPVPTSGCEELVFEPRGGMPTPCLNSFATAAGAPGIGIHFGDPSRFGEISVQIECLDGRGPDCWGYVDVFLVDTCFACETWHYTPSFGTHSFFPRDVDAENGERTGADYVLAGDSVRFVVRVCPP